TTGLGYDPDDPQHYRPDVVLEVAALATTPQLDITGRFGPFPVTATGEDLGLMGEYVRRMHTGTGLLERVHSPLARPVREVDADLADWMSEQGMHHRVVLAGSSVKLDFEFLRRHMPVVFARLHYRVIDSSSFKEALRAWRPGAVETWEAQAGPSAHSAMTDIEASVAELAHYRHALGHGSSV